MQRRLQPENLVSTRSSSTLDEVCDGSDAVSTVDTTLAIPSLAPQLTCRACTTVPVHSALIRILRSNLAFETHFKFLEIEDCIAN